MKNHTNHNTTIERRINSNLALPSRGFYMTWDAKCLSPPLWARQHRNYLFISSNSLLKRFLPNESDVICIRARPHISCKTQVFLPSHPAQRFWNTVRRCDTGLSKSWSSKHFCFTNLSHSCISLLKTFIPSRCCRFMSCTYVDIYMLMSVMCVYKNIYSILHPIIPCLPGVVKCWIQTSFVQC